MRIQVLTAALTLGLASAACAFEWTGTAANLTFAQAEADSGATSSTRLTGSFGFTVGRNWETAIVSHKQDFSGDFGDLEGSMLGISVVRGFGPGFVVGLYHDCNWHADPTVYEFHAVGAEAMATLGNGADVTAYYGRYQAGDVTEGAELFGIRGDLDMAGPLSLSIFLQEDRHEDFALRRTGLGVGYEIARPGGAPLAIRGELSRYSRDGGPDITEARIMGTISFGGPKPRPTGFLGNHSVQANFPFDVLPPV